MLADEAVSAGHRHAQADAAHDRQVRQVVTEEGDLFQLHWYLLAQLGQCGKLVFTALDQVLDTEVGSPALHQWRVAATDDCGLHTGGDQHLDAVAVQGVERLEFGAVGHEVQAAIGEHAIHVEDRQANSAGAFQQCQLRFHTTPARNRSCMFRAPTGRPCSSTTNRPLILPSSITFSASAASTPWRTVLQREVMTCSMRALRMSTS